MYNCHETSLIITFIKNCDVLSLEDNELFKKITNITNFIVKLQKTAIFKYKIGIYIIHINKKIDVSLFRDNYTISNLELKSCDFIQV